ncbi:sulfatase-like hydrolase/transferase [Algibacter mikhailovii]|nr:sulfatase-like hydrolase/transferase [Algibacter mikhailovii]
MKSIYLLLCLVLTLSYACSNAEDVLVELEKTEGTPEETPEETNNTKPNILLVIADDMGLDATPGYDIGALKPNMPNLQALLNNGLRFNNLWSYPLCTPTRGSMLTGKYGFRTGVTTVSQEMPISETSIQEYLDENNSGYAHAVIGKWHLSRDLDHPTNSIVGDYAGFLSGTLRSYWNWDLVENGQSTNTTTYSTSKFTDLAIDWIDAQEQPWFLWLAYNAPHTPFHLPPNELHSQGALPSGDADIAANPLPYYLAMLEAMDSEMGRLIASMSEEERDNTVIIFMGDNGTPNQVVQTYNSRRAKNSLYQGGVNVPMVISGKNITRIGEQEDALLNTTDLFATIASIAGNEIDEINDSKNFESMLSTPGQEVRNFAYSEIGTDVNSLDYTIRDATYKLIRFNTGEEGLYHLIDDPLESINLLSANRLPLSNEALNAMTALEAELVRLRQ